MPNQIKIALATLNPTVGDISGNAELTLAARAEVMGAEGADLSFILNFA
jgi:predicted amidohydrolase